MRMPVYVHEIVIRAVVAETGAAAPPGLDQAGLVETCVEQVLEILEAGRER
jgi:hypothetical protein